MRHTFLLALSILFLSVSGLGQSTATESQGMQALVVEVRELRKDLQTSNGNALKAQVLLYRLQLQQATVARATEHLSNARAKLAETQDHRRAVSSRLKGNQEFMDNAETAQISPADRKQVQSEISRLKEELENLAAEEQQRQSAEMEAEEQLRTEQAKLGGLEDRVDRLEKDLESRH